MIIPGLIDPLRGAGIISSAWGDPRPHLDTYHYGIDIRSAVGTPVYAAIGGTITRVDRTADSSAGRHVIIRSSANGATFSHRYLHLGSIAAIKVGAEILQGDKVGTVGIAGTSSPHLHFDMFGDAFVIARYKSAYGTPAGGFPAKRYWGVQFPCEPFVPGKYMARASQRSASRGIPIYAERPEPIAPHLVSAAAAKPGINLLVWLGAIGLTGGALYLGYALITRNR